MREPETAHLGENLFELPAGNQILERFDHGRATTEIGAVRTANEETERLCQTSNIPCSRLGVQPSEGFLTLLSDSW